MMAMSETTLPAGESRTGPIAEIDEWLSMTKEQRDGYMDSARAALPPFMGEVEHVLPGMRVGQGDVYSDGTLVLAPFWGQRLRLSDPKVYRPLRPATSPAPTYRLLEAGEIIHESYRVPMEQFENAHKQFAAALERIIALTAERDQLLEMMWLDGPGELHETIEDWKVQFAGGWVRKTELDEAEKTIAAQHRLMTSAEQRGAAKSIEQQDAEHLAATRAYCEAGQRLCPAGCELVLPGALIQRGDVDSAGKPVPEGWAGYAVRAENQVVFRPRPRHPATDLPLETSEEMAATFGVVDENAREPDGAVRRYCPRCRCETEVMHDDADRQECYNCMVPFDEPLTVDPPEDEPLTGPLRRLEHIEEIGLMLSELEPQDRRCVMAALGTIFSV